MKNQTTYIVAIPSYIVRKGLIYMLNRMPGYIKIIEVCNEKKFYESINNIEFNGIIIDYEFKQMLPANSLDNKECLIITNYDKMNDIIGNSFIININCNREKAIDILLNYHTKISSNKPITESTELSSREKDVVRCIALGKTNKDIAEELFISQHTVITHRKNITGKLEIKTVAGLTVYALLNGLVKMEEIKE